MEFAQHISKLLGSFWQKLGSHIQLLKDMESLVNPTSSWLIWKECHHRHPFCHRLYLLLPENKRRNGLKKCRHKYFFKVKRTKKGFKEGFGFQKGFRVSKRVSSFQKGFWVSKRVLGFQQGFGFCIQTRYPKKK